jgi:acyl carrier protein
MPEIKKMSVDEITKSVIDVLLNYGVPESQIGLDTNFLTDMRLDSLDVAAIYIEMESYFNIQIITESENGLLTVREIAKYISAKQAKK